MVSQWLTSTNPIGYDAVFNNWWGRRGGYLHDSLLQLNPERGRRLAELARLDRQLAGMDAAKRAEHLRQHAKDFPLLNKLPRLDPKRTPLAHNQKPSHKDPHPAGKNPNRKPTNGPHTKVHHKHSPHHHVHHAKAGHHHHAKAHHHGGKKK
jgi:hypothetical protein